MLDFNQYKEDIICGLDYIIQRNKDIVVPDDQSDSDSDILEEEDREYMNHADRYTISIFNKLYDVDAFTSLKDAEFIKNNIDNIEYLYSDDDEWDSVIGNIEDYFNGDFVLRSKYADSLYKSKTLSEFINICK